MLSSCGLRPSRRKERRQAGRPDLRRSLPELLAVVAGLLLVVLLAPLGSPEFPRVTAAAGLVAAGYAAVRLALCPADAARWGLRLPRELDGCREGCLTAGYLTLASLAPAAAVRLGVEAPTAPHPAAYLLWCAVQDFLFFALVQRDLEDLAPPAVAVAGASALFGLSHYPFGSFMAVSVGAGAAWGWLFHRTRSLVPVVCCHWLMGLLVLN
jgi:membrane protease YdiL (CAAX protease family)